MLVVVLGAGVFVVTVLAVVTVVVRGSEVTVVPVVVDGQCDPAGDRPAVAPASAPRPVSTGSRPLARWTWTVAGSNRTVVVARIGALRHASNTLPPLERCVIPIG